MRTVKFFTLGCKANQYDTQGIREQFARRGFREIDNGHCADICVINTCTVTHRADSDSFQLIRRAKRESPRARIIVTGCLAELDGDKIKNIDKEAIIIKNSDKHRIASFLPGFCQITSKRDNEITNASITCFKGHTRAFLKIQDGCNNRCSYCKVPLVRGASRSKPKEVVIQEARQLAKSGFQEIVLTGICLGSYGKDLGPGSDIAEIVTSLEDIEGLLRVRLSSIEANDITDGLIEKIAKSSKLCPHLHIPLQSGDNEVLKRMRRSYTRQDYLKLIKKVKNKIPGIAITTDVLVGFPGETEKNFQNTLDLVKKILPLKVHIFPYSKREGTPAAGLKDDLSYKELKERTGRLAKMSDSCSLAYKKKFLNRKLPVLIECRVKGRPGFWEGHTANYIKVMVNSKKGLKNRVILAELIKPVNECILGNY